MSNQILKKLQIQALHKEKPKKRTKDLPRGNDQHFPEMTQPSHALCFPSLSRCVSVRRCECVCLCVTLTEN